MTKEKEELDESFEIISLKEISNLEKHGKDFDNRLRKKAEKFLKDRIANCKTKEELKKTIASGKIARINFCSIDKPGVQCAGKIEKDIKADVRGILANEKEKPFGNKKCLICGKPGKEVVYVARAY